MKRGILVWMAAQALVAALELTNAAQAQPRPTLLQQLAGVPDWETGRVARVVDGDTYDLLVGGQLVRVRLLGIDAPEHDQPFGAQATDSVRARMQGRLVWVQRVKTDLYGRTLGQVRLLPAAPGARAVTLDSLLVVRGWAWAFDPDHAHAQRAAQQQAAQDAGRGLWKCGIDGAVPPKVWRALNQLYKRRYAGGCTW